MEKKKLDDRTVKLLQEVAETFWREDRPVRERQIRTWRRLKLMWEGFHQIWYSETAHDWRVYDNQLTYGDDGDQAYYDKPVNVFRAYLETVIAALSVLVPKIKCFPDDADNAMDLATAKAGDKIAQLIGRHNNDQLLWLQALFIFCTEGMVACHNYSKESKDYGFYQENQTDEIVEEHEYTVCSLCNANLADVTLNSTTRENFAPNDEDAVLHSLQDAGEMFCPECMELMNPEVRRENLIVPRLVGVTNKPKSRQCMEMYGGLYVKVPVWARKQADIPYLFWSYETNYAVARERFPWIREKIQPTGVGGNEQYEQWGRQSPQYQGDFPENNVTIRNTWLRCSAFEILKDEKDVEFLKKKFPDGVRLVMVNDQVAEYENESLDDSWTLTHNPLSDFIYFDPLGLLLVSVQELTNDIISLTEQTMEHGIGQVFADQAVLDFDAYSQMEASPGSIFPANARPGKTLSEGFFEVRTATLSQEVMPFFQQIQSLGQLVVGAQPSLFGGDLQGSKTASEYSMSRAQALQRLQNTWKIFTTFWKEIHGKVIPRFIKDMRDDEKFVEQTKSGDFINVVIQLAELNGRIGNIELESNENLPVTWSQRRDNILKLVELQNPELFALLKDPENLPLLYEAIGIPDFAVPGEDSRNKQYEEIKILSQTSPIPIPVSPEEELLALEQGLSAPEPQEESSVPVEEFDNDGIELEICIRWLNSPAGQLAKVENPEGYKNVMLHARAHKLAMQMKMMEMAPPVDEGAAPGNKPKETNQEAPIMRDSDVPANV